MYPLATIDFEATSLELDSVPIEVGIAIAAGGQSPIVTWSALIQPAQNWDMQALWDPDAARVHGIRLRELRNGIAPSAAIRHLNALLRGIESVWCGDGKYDLLWFDRLREAAMPVCAAFEVLPTAEFPGVHLVGSRAANGQPMGSATAHRAGPDAEQLCSTLMRAARAECGGVHRGHAGL